LRIFLSLENDKISKNTEIDGEIINKIIKLRQKATKCDTERLDAIRINGVELR